MGELRHPIKGRFNDKDVLPLSGFSPGSRRHQPPRLTHPGTAPAARPLPEAQLPTPRFPCPWEREETRGPCSARPGTRRFHLAAAPERGKLGSDTRESCFPWQGQSSLESSRFPAPLCLFGEEPNTPRSRAQQQFQGWAIGSPGLTSRLIALAGAICSRSSRPFERSATEARPHLGFKQTLPARRGRSLIFLPRRSPPCPRRAPGARVSRPCSAPALPAGDPGAPALPRGDPCGAVRAGASSPWNGVPAGQAREQGESPSAVISDAPARGDANASLLQPPVPGITPQLIKQEAAEPIPAPRASTLPWERLPDPPEVLRPRRTPQPQPCCTGPGRSCQSAAVRQDLCSAILKGSRRNTRRIHPKFPQITLIQATILPNTHILSQPSPSPALQPAHLRPTDPRFPSTFAPNPPSLWPLCPHPQKATHRLPCSKDSPTHLAYLWPTRAALLPPIPFPLPIPAQQLLLSRCSSRPALLLPPPAPVSLLTPPSLSLRNSTWFSHPSSSFSEHFPSSALLSHLQSSHLHSPGFLSTRTGELLLFPSSPFLGISFNSKFPPSGYVQARLLPPSIALSLRLLSLGQGPVKPH